MEQRCRRNRRNWRRSTRTCEPCKECCGKIWVMAGRVMKKRLHSKHAKECMMRWPNGLSCRPGWTGQWKRSSESESEDGVSIGRKPLLARSPFLSRKSSAAEPSFPNSAMERDGRRTSGGSAIVVRPASLVGPSILSRSRARTAARATICSIGWCSSRHCMTRSARGSNSRGRHQDGPTFVTRAGECWTRPVSSPVGRSVLQVDRCNAVVK